MFNQPAFANVGLTLPTMSFLFEHDSIYPSLRQKVNLLNCPTKIYPEQNLGISHEIWD